jgi:hypothetical protein
MQEEYPSRSVATILTRPPEVVCVLKLAISKSVVFAVFDSHPRPKHHLGASLIFNKSLDTTAAYLDSLFHVDSSLLDDENLQWQVQLLGNFNAQLYIAKGIRQKLDTAMLDEALLEASLDILSMKLKLEEAHQEILDLNNENKWLERRYERKVLDLEAELRRIGKQAAPSPVGNEISFFWRFNRRESIGPTGPQFGDIRHF